MQLASEGLSRGGHDAGHEQGDRQCDRAEEGNATQEIRQAVQLFPSLVHVRALECFTRHPWRAKGEVMRRLVTASLSAAALVLSGLMANAALAQDKVAIKVLSEDAKVRVFEATYAPGAENPSPPSSTTRVVRALTAGTLERRYADGKKEKVDWKPGMVQVLPPSGAYTTKNVGKTKLQLYVVAVK